MTPTLSQLVVSVFVGGVVLGLGLSALRALVGRGL
jgi:hypothetical protein